MTGAFDVISPSGMQVGRNSVASFQSSICLDYAECKEFYSHVSLVTFAPPHPFEQIGFVQYSDDAKTEFKLNTYHDKGVVVSALKNVRYRGGNTKTGTDFASASGNYDIWSWC